MKPFVPPGIEETLAEQDDLERLTADRPLPEGEVFIPNAFYGLAAILREYAGLPEGFPIMAVIPHSVMLDPGFVWGAEIEAKVPGVLSYPRYRDTVYEGLTDKIVVPSASPYIYLRRMVSSVPESDRQGTIFFPSHSTHHVTTVLNPEELVKQLQQVDDRFRPVSICIYWRDVELGRHIPFIESGFRVVSAGHIYDPAFLYRLHWLCSQHRYSSSNALGSHVFFSIESGCIHASILEQSVTIDRRAISATEPFGGSMDRPERVRDVVAQLQPLYKRHPADVEQRNVAGMFLRSSEVRSPSDLSRLISELRTMDRRGYRTATDTARYVMPGWARRSLPAKGFRYAARSLRRLSGIAVRQKD